MIPSIHITSIRLSITRNNDHINLGAWFLVCSSSSPVPNTMSVVSWSLWPGSMLELQLAGLVCGCGSMLEQSWWLRSIDIISGRNSIQATSNNKYADKDKYKWAVNMYECLTVDLFDLNPPMALNANSFGFHVVSRKYIYPHMQFFMTVWNNFTMQHELGLNVTTVVWMRNWWIIHIPSSSLILDFTTSFSNLGKSQIIFQWSTSILHLLECAYTIVRSTFETIANDHKTFPHT